MIPSQLKYLSFCRIKRGNKAPFELDWTNKTYSYNEISKFLNENYGVVCGHDNIAVIDCDEESLEIMVNEMLPETFSVKTGGGGKHFYYYISELKNKIILKDNEKHLGEIQSYGSQVVGAGSIHPNGNEYEVVDNVGIKDISLEKLNEVLGKFMIGNTEEILKQEDVEDYSDLILKIVKKWEKGNRQDLALSTAGYLRKEERLGINKVKQIIKEVCRICGDEEVKMRMRAVDETFKKDEKNVKGITGLKEFYIKGSLKEEVLTLIALKKSRDATELILESFLEKNYIYSTRDDVKSEMWIYENGIYVPQGVTYIKEFCRQVLGKVYTTTLANEVTEKIRSETYIDQDKFFNVNYVDEIPINHGILNLKTRQVNPFDPEKIFFNKLPLNYNPIAECKLIEEFFEDVLHNKDDVKVMFEIFGFLLLKEYRIEKAFMFNGNGRNGKSKTLSLMERFVGEENVCNVPISSMQKDNFDLEDLFGKLLNNGGDTGKTSLKDTGVFKSLTGRDGLNLKRKFKSSLRFVNYAKHIFPCNDLPIVYDNTEGFWSKWVLIDFPYEFKTEKEIEELSKEDKINKKVIDINILNKISSQEELDGLLNQALDGLDRILKQNNFSFSRGTEYIKKTWKRRSNSFLAFCEDCLEENEDSTIMKMKLKKSYGNYCKQHNLKTRMGDKVIKNTLENEYFVEETRDMNRKTMWEGIRFKDLPRVPPQSDPISNNLILPIGKNTLGKYGKQQFSEEELDQASPEFKKELEKQQSK